MPTRDLLFCAAGPLAIGALVGLPFGAEVAALEAGAVLAVAAGLGLAMIPALYIASALAGYAPPADEFARSAAAALRAAGIAMLGLAAPVAFLIATVQSGGAVLTLGGAALAGGVLLGLRALYLRLFGGRDSLIPPLLFFAWSATGLAIGARMYTQTPVF